MLPKGACKFYLWGNAEGRIDLVCFKQSIIMTLMIKYMCTLLVYGLFRSHIIGM